ncbi:MAG TPA: glycosyltransferase, partial [Polyangiales bacterium]|nr:glycosyltransferase [Polyangiales bacterium]
MHAKPAVSVVLPTYNEALALPVIVPSILRTLSEANIAAEVIVVDDDSPDGTAAVAEELAREHPVRVKKRTTERGLATAVLEGFAMSEAPVCVVMDADGSHPVSALPAMVRMIQEDKADVVVGSRHVEGGGSRDWPVFSQIKSKLAAALAFGVTSMTDPTTGFMALRRSLLSRLSLDPVGWKIVLEVVVKAAPVRVAEVPIIFTDRELGESKQSLRVLMQYLAHLGKLYTHRYPSLAELVKFSVVGLLGMCIDLATLHALKELLGIDTRLCAVAGFVVAVTSNFALNRRYTFKSARELPLLFSYVTYVGANLAGLAVRLLVIQVFMTMAGIDAGRGYLLSNMVGIVLAMLLNFVGAKFFAFDPDRLRSADTDSAPVPLSSAPPALARALPLFFLACAVYAFSTGVLHAELRRADEGVNVTMAQNIRESSGLLLRPSVYPGGRADWRREDLPALGNLPFYPLLLALTPAGLGLSGMALLSFLALCVTLYCSAKLCALVDPRAGLITALLMASSPALLAAFRRIELEPILTAFCAAGAYLFVRGAWQRTRTHCFAGGVCLGLGFLTKLWLIVPYAFALFAFCVIEAAVVRRDGTSAGLRRSVTFGALGFALSASAHLAYVAMRAPGDLPLWMSHVYLGIFSGQGVTGDKLSALSRYAGEQRGAFYYPLVLYRDHFFLAPLALFGLGELLRSIAPRAARLLGMIAGAITSLVVLSVPAVKTPAYVLAVQPFLYMLAALCLSALASAPLKTQPAARVQVRLGIGVCIASVLLVFATRALGVTRGLSLPYLALHALGMTLAAGAGVLWLQR